MRSLVRLKKLEAVARTLVDEVVLNRVDCYVWHKSTCEGAADNRLALVKDKAANVRTLGFVSDAFINFDLGNIFQVDGFQVGWVVFRSDTQNVRTEDI